ncbi:unnamed protein product [Ectocarpus sp. CCAP 1310/34]|nr:unnamed protein product [Ectocarpus sp. CCAP 1310/34]
MDAMKLDGVQSLPLEFNSYAETVISMLRDRSSGLTDAKLLKHLQNVCIVYACLAVKRNAGIVSTQAKHAASAQGYKDIAVPGFSSGSRKTWTRRVSSCSRGSRSRSWGMHGEDVDEGRQATTGCYSIYS